MPVHEISDFLHPLALSDREWTTAVTVPAADTVISILFQGAVMLLRHGISGLRQIIVFIYQSYINTGRTGLAMIAVTKSGFLRCYGYSF